MFIDAVVIKGQGRSFSCSIEYNENADIFKPFDLTDYNIRFRVMGAPTADAQVIVEHLITQVSDIDMDGQITNAENGEFCFTITKEDTQKLGLGNKPIMVDILDIETNDVVYTLTEGNVRNEFSRIQVVQV